MKKFLILLTSVFISCEKRKINNCASKISGPYNQVLLCGTNFIGDVFVEPGADENKIKLTVENSIELTAEFIDGECNFIIEEKQIGSTQFPILASGTGNYDENNDAIEIKFNESFCNFSNLETCIDSNIGTYVGANSCNIYSSNSTIVVTKNEMELG